MKDQTPREEALFNAALEQPTPEDRATYLAQVCGSDAELRQRVEALLRAAEEAGTFLDRPAAHAESGRRQDHRRRADDLL